MWLELHRLLAGHGSSVFMGSGLYWPTRPSLEAEAARTSVHRCTGSRPCDTGGLWRMSYSGPDKVHRIVCVVLCWHTSQFASIIAS